jgi:NADH dehydrogenase
MGGGATLQQPIDARDVILAILAALGSRPEESRILSLGGPESLPHRELLQRAARITGGKPRFLPIPFALVRAVAALLEHLSAHPPLTRAWLGVLQHDDRVDATQACKQLGIELTPLDDTLRHCLSEESEIA